MDDRIKLNLGCGFVYKPGYVNIDKFDGSVADKISDAGDLPFESNSVDLIEADQLIEHFDHIHCKYVLSEWFRVLKPGRILVLETPDLEKSIGKFIPSEPETKKTTLQWIYGIDSPGMQHKTGFTFDLLKNLLR
jgi:predicted SAM-dependent methyltransferase